MKKINSKSLISLIIAAVMLATAAIVPISAQQRIYGQDGVELYDDCDDSDLSEDYYKYNAFYPGHHVYLKSNVNVYPEKMTFVLESFEDGSSTIYVIGLDVSDCSNCRVLYDAPSFFARGIEKGHLRLSYEAPNTVNAYPSLIGYNLVYVDVPFITLGEVEEGTEMQVFYTNVDYNPEAAREAARLAHEREEQEKKEKELACSVTIDVRPTG